MDGNVVGVNLAERHLLKLCEWQESNLRTPTRTDLESVTFGLLVTLALNVALLRG